MLKDYNVDWLSPWKRALLSRLHHLDMFKFGVEDVSAYLREAGFTTVQTLGAGVQYLLHATKP